MKTLGCKVSNEFYEQIKQLPGSNSEILRKALESYVNQALTTDAVITKQIPIPHERNVKICLQLIEDE